MPPQRLTADLPAGAAVTAIAPLPPSEPAEEIAYSGGENESSEHRESPSERLSDLRRPRFLEYALARFQQAIAPKPHPEQRFVVGVTAADEIVCRAPGQAPQSIGMADLGAVYVETNNSGPWGSDLWWLLDDKNGRTKVTFPQLATGEEAVLDRLSLLPGFQMQGMHSVENARFLCWSVDAP